MENNTYPFSSVPYGRESSLVMTASVAGDRGMVIGLLLAYLLIGLASYIMAFWLQRSRLKVFNEAIIFSLSGQHSSLRGVQNIYCILLSVLFNDILHAITAVILVIMFAGSTCNSGLTCPYAFIPWFLSRCLGVILHLLNAFLCLLFLYHPQFGAKLRCIYTLVALLTIVFFPFYLFLSQVALFGLGAITIGLALAIIAKCTLSNASPSAAARSKPIVLVAMLTFLFVFAPTFILQCLIISASNHGEPIDKYFTVYEKTLFLTSAHLLMDGLLCYVILKLPPEEEEQQQDQQQQEQHLENPNYVISANVTQ